MEQQIRPWTPDEQPGVLAAIERAFLSDPDPTASEPLGMLEHDRTLSVWDDGRPVATAAAFGLRLALPGASAPVAGVTLVSVQPTHRRRGLLTGLMRRQLSDLHTGGEAVSALWASEPAIYGRFGYGLATRSVSVRLRRGTALRPGLAGEQTIREAAPAEVRHELAAVWDAWCSRRPGEYARSSAWWEQVLFDPPGRREGHTAVRCALLTDGAGYALFSTKGSWDDDGPAGELRVRELVAADGPAKLRLWEHLLGVDLVGEWRARYLPLDDPLLHAAVDVRRMQPRIFDGLYVRLARVGEALQARRYGAEVDVVLDVADAQLPDNAGRWRLSGGPDGATCHRTTDPPDLSLGIEELGAAYLGGTTLSALEDSGRVREHRPGAVVHASRAFRGDVEPVCSHIF